MDHDTTRPRLRRRALLTGGLLGAGAVTGAGHLATAAATPPSTGSAPSRRADAGRRVAQVDGISTVIDTSHVSGDVAELLSGYFIAKSRPDVEATMAFFAREPFVYVDATLGLVLPTWQSLRATFEQLMPTWGPEANSYATRIVGGPTGAVVMFVDAPGTFGPQELRLAGVVDIRDGLVLRQADYWDGRHSTLAQYESLRVPAEQYPQDLGEDVVDEAASQRVRRVIERLNGSLAAGDVETTVGLFGPDAALEDAPAHLRLEGRRAIGRFLTRSAGLLPYAQPGTVVRHVVGGDLGGGYEWSGPGPVARGATAVELDAGGSITRLTAMWNGADVDEARLVDLARAAVEG